MRMTWIKICGTTNLEDARLAVEAGADALGFVFAESPRRVTAEQAGEIIAELPTKVEKVGVFAGESGRRIRQLVEQAGLTGIQLHGGEEDLQKIEQGGAWVEQQSLRVIVCLSGVLADPTQSAAGIGVRRSEGKPRREALLLDSSTREKLGGTGATFDWTKWAPFLKQTRPVVDVIVAGGLRSENVGEAIRILHPWGVDVVSGVEREPGKKDPEKVRAFVNAVRQADKEHSRL